MWKGYRVYSIILAGGSSERLAADIPKQFIKLAGKQIIEHTISVFESHELIDEIIIVVNPNYRYILESICANVKYKKVSKILNGGKTRQESSMIGVFSIHNEESYVLIHDAVRPFISKKIITDVIKILDKYESVDTAIYSPDTIIQRNGDIIENIPDRDKMMLGQTPQGFRTKVIKSAYRLYQENPVKVTDDCGLVLKYGLGKVGIVNGERFNIKLTYPEDLYFADKIFQVRSTTVNSGEYEVNFLPRLNKKVIVIFGASRGIGKAILNLSREYGAFSYGFSKSTGVDVTEPNAVRRALEAIHKECGRIDFIINTAALLRFGSLESREYESIKEELLVNYYGSVVVAKESIPFIKESKGAILLFTSSSYTRGRAFYGIYSSSKAALVNLIQSLAEEIDSYGCKINAINPERTNTELRKEVFGYEDPATLLSVEEVAKMSLIVLLSDFTGQIIDVRRGLK